MCYCTIAKHMKQKIKEETVSQLESERCSVRIRLTITDFEDEGDDEPRDAGGI